MTMAGDPVLVIGENELGAPVGEQTNCPNCGEHHAVMYGERVLADGTHVPSKMLAFCKCPANGISYLVGLNGREVPL
jgi:hypothetical protein